MKTKRYLSLNHEMCERAVLEAFDKKWFRRDYLATVEKYGGVSRAQLSSAARVNDWNPRLEAVNGIALEMEQRIEDLLDGETDELKWTQADLARATGIRPTTISDYYNEIAERMNLNHLDLICEALDCSPTEILVREPNPEPRVRNRTGFEKPVTGQRKDGE